MLHQQLLRQPGILPPKKQPAPVRVLHLGVDMLRLGGEIIHLFLLVFVPLHKIHKTRVGRHIKILPVVQPRPLQLGIVYGKGHRLHQMQPGPRRRAGPCYIPHILRDPRLYQYNVQNRHFYLSPFRSCSGPCRGLVGAAVPAAPPPMRTAVRMPASGGRPAAPARPSSGLCKSPYISNFRLVHAPLRHPAQLPSNDPILPYFIAKSPLFVNFLLKKVKY